ncbi:hypothetical protein M9435_004888 [Picochlorum sp. BPE23]|nr:hypothetical protein M9435_004888 [Picochlorum sp. BPE23]
MYLHVCACSNSYKHTLYIAFISIPSPKKVARRFIILLLLLLLLPLKWHPQQASQSLNEQYRYIQTLPGVRITWVFLNFAFKFVKRE